MLDRACWKINITV